jgi:hypothetical protein
MNHQPAPAQARRIPRTLSTLGGLAVFTAAAIGLAPAASATPAPPDPSFTPVPPLPPLPPAAAAPAQFPPWAIAVILAATIVLSVGTTLITLALEHIRWVHREAAAIPEPQASTRTSFTAPAHQAEILSGHPPRDRA